MDLLPSKKKHHSKKKRRDLERRAKRLAVTEPLVPRTREIYVRGKSFELLQDFPFIGAIIEAFKTSFVHQGGPCVLLIKHAMTLAPPRFKLTVTDLEDAFDTLKKMSEFLPGTDDINSREHKSTTISLEPLGFVKTGNSKFSTKRLLDTLHSFDSVGMYSLSVIAGVIKRSSLFGIAQNDNALKLLASISKNLDRPGKLNSVKEIVSINYDAGAVLEGHVDPSILCTFVTTRTVNHDRATLLQFADMGSEELKYDVAYHRWDLVFFPAQLHHQTFPYDGEREIMNIFY